MALNVKAAMLLCTAFMGGLCWVVSRVALPMIVVATPSEAATQLAAVENPAPTSPGEAPDGGAAGVFARQSTFEAEAAANRANAERLAAAPVPAAAPAARNVALPPLAQSATANESVVMLDESRASDQTLASPLLAMTTMAGPAPPTPPPASDANQGASPADEPTRGSSATGSKYTVQKGDSLTRISQRQMNSTDRRVFRLLVEVNPKLRARQNKLFVGEVLTIPDAATVARVLRGERPEVVLAAAQPAPGKSARPKAEQARLASAKAARERGVSGPGTTPMTKAGAEPPKGKPSARSPETPNRRWYTIRARDSLVSIAERFLNDKRRWREIADINGLDQSGKIIPGRRIKLPDSPAAQG